MSVFLSGCSINKYLDYPLHSEKLLCHSGFEALHSIAASSPAFPLTDETIQLADAHVTEMTDFTPEVIKQIENKS